MSNHKRKWRHELDNKPRHPDVITHMCELIHNGDVIAGATLARETLLADPHWGNTTEFHNFINGPGKAIMDVEKFPWEGGTR
jgi:hypothetical protein